MSLIIIDKNKLDKLTAQLTVKLVILSMRTRTAKERLNTILDNLEPALETLKEITEKKNNNSRMVDFFETNDDCPTCEQHIDENFKEEVIMEKEKVILLLQSTWLQFQKN